MLVVCVCCGVLGFVCDSLLLVVFIVVFFSCCLIAVLCFVFSCCGLLVTGVRVTLDKFDGLFAV